MADGSEGTDAGVKNVSAWWTKPVIGAILVVMKIRDVYKRQVLHLPLYGTARVPDAEGQNGRTDILCIGREFIGNLNFVLYTFLLGRYLQQPISV